MNTIAVDTISVDISKYRSLFAKQSKITMTNITKPISVDVLFSYFGISLADYQEEIQYQQQFADDLKNNRYTISSSL